MKVRIGIDIGGTSIKLGIFQDASNQVFLHQKWSTAAFETAPAMVTAIAVWIKQQLTSQDLALEKIGIAAPNGNYQTGQIEFAANLNWGDIVPIRALFQAEFDCPIHFDNDANAATLAEWSMTDPKVEDFVLITLGTGLGAGIISNGKLVHGANGFAGELGHVIIEKNGRLCGCGRRGCLETYVSATGVVRTAKERFTKQGNTSILFNQTTELTARDIYEAMLQGDRLASEIFQFTGETLGFALANLAAITQPAQIVLAGGLSRAGKYLLEPTIQSFQVQVLPILRDKTIIKISNTDPNQLGILGASLL
ncbi:MAG: ROK family protein [Saprospiraceae bacterium]|nr:ROK family protein [Saprospiraceae bacterium]